MPIVGLGEVRWRMLRRILLSPKRTSTFQKVRSMRRIDWHHAEVLVQLGLVARISEDPEVLRVTDKGAEVAQLGEVDLFELNAAVQAAVTAVDQRWRDEARAGAEAGRVPVGAGRKAKK